ncbi:hypothetical protein DPMN_125216 [Dreissena polymorpha]|uniref:Uncharacterized protein n=1 Tax=Dreissena polymorpha TaxID=45954 RepID=A0A9D4JWW4_DREPO|nr:hypothetical protein DPMN_119574 [Dreissena polymorpha]KAH3823417.1 hypothetical protein DPMN_125216 [Dreissena polymorpha]
MLVGEREYLEVAPHVRDGDHKPDSQASENGIEPGSLIWEALVITTALTRQPT